MDVLIGTVLLLIIIAVVVGIIAVFIGLLVTSIWFRILVGGILIWLIWSSVGADPTGVWIGTVLIGLGIISPWLIIIGVVGFVVGFLLTRR